VIWPAPQWLALFYDLAFAAGIIAIAASYGFERTATGALWLAVTYGILASTWLLTGGATGAFSPEPREVTTGVVLLTVVQMAAVLLLALASGDSIATATWVFDMLLAFLLATVIAQYALAHRRGHAVPTRAMVFVTIAMATLGLTWILPDALGLALWIVALAVLGIAAESVVLSSRIDTHRLAHRLGELTLIIIGEILVKMTLSLKAETLWSVRLWALLPLLGILVAVWWAYFTGPVDASSIGGRRRIIWVPAHWALHAALLALAVGLGKLMVNDSTLDDANAVTALLTGPAVLMAASLAVLDWVTHGPRLVPMTVATVILIVVMIVASSTSQRPTVTAYVVAMVTLAAVALPRASRGVVERQPV
jgi:low temperature requirement protein LtrA